MGQNLMHNTFKLACDGDIGKLEGILNSGFNINLRYIGGETLSVSAVCF